MISESATSSILHDWLLFSGDDWRFLFEGFTKSPCTIPCSTFHTRTKYISRVKEIYNDKFRVKLFFIPEMQVNNIAVIITTITIYTIQVTKTDFVKPTLSSLLSEVFLRIQSKFMMSSDSSEIFTNSIKFDQRDFKCKGWWLNWALARSECCTGSATSWESCLLV